MLKQILIDADTGIDDSIAILFAMNRPGRSSPEWPGSTPAS